MIVFLAVLMVIMVVFLTMLMVVMIRRFAGGEVKVGVLSEVKLQQPFGFH